MNHPDFPSNFYQSHTTDGNYTITHQNNDSPSCEGSPGNEDKATAIKRKNAEAQKAYRGRKKEEEISLKQTVNVLQAENERLKAQVEQYQSVLLGAAPMTYPLSPSYNTHSVGYPTDPRYAQDLSFNAHRQSSF